MKKKLFISLLLSLTAMAFAVSAYAQVTTASLGGKVTDASGESVPGAAVVALRMQKAVITLPVCVPAAPTA